jgi:hypothetical protein
MQRYSLVLSYHGLMSNRAMEAFRQELKIRRAEKAEDKACDTEN